MNASQDTVSKQRRTRGLRPFVKGDPRINRNGRPKSFYEFRKLCQRVLSETVETKDGERMLAAEMLVRNWLKSNEPAAQRALAEYAYGKVPDKLEATGLENRTQLILHYAHERAAIERAAMEQQSAVNGEVTRRPLLPDAD
jgi:hypothetical protein